jgi:hypothetical protein
LLRDPRAIRLRRTPELHLAEDFLTVFADTTMPRPFSSPTIRW